MRTFLLLCTLASSMALTASAQVTYNTNGSTLSCGGVAGCVQNSPTSVSIGGLTFTYNAGSGSVTTPSIINYGNITTTGTGSSVSFNGVLLTVNINSAPPGLSGSLGGAVTGTISGNNSQVTLNFTTPNVTTGFGTLPGVAIGTQPQITYQVLNNSLGVAVSGQTTIQGAVTTTVPGLPGTPIPSTFYLALLGVAAAGLYQFQTRRNSA